MIVSVAYTMPCYVEVDTETGEITRQIIATEGMKLAEDDTPVEAFTLDPIQRTP